MDCNKEEAVRVKQLAERKMMIKDFSGALKIAVRAQRLYPELENISQLIIVCEVNCSAEKNRYDYDKDWYGILKVDPSADDMSIKRQYRKLALILHPDKNKFYGSAEAFKLIGEAQRLLLDREKRAILDGKCRAFGKFKAPNLTRKQPRSHFGDFQFTTKPVSEMKESSKMQGNVNRVRKKRKQEAIERQSVGQQQPRRSTRSKRIVCYKENVKCSIKPVSEKKEPLKMQGNVNRIGKRRKQESIESHCFGQQQPRRSARSKRIVCYKENAV